MIADLLRRTLQAVLLPLAMIGLLIALWWGATADGANPIVPTPAAVLDSFAEGLRNGLLWRHASASLLRVGAGFGLAALVALPLGLWMGWVLPAHRALNPLVQLLRPISPIAWIPLAILWFGLGDFAPVFLIALSSALPMVVQISAAVRAIERRYLRAAVNLGLPWRALLLRVLLPAVLPDLILALRIGLGVAWLAVVAAEMMAVPSGLGFLILDSRNAGNRYDMIFIAMGLIGAIGLLLDGAMRALERLRLVQWRHVR